MICTSALASKKPYYLIGQLDNEIMLQYRKITSWASDFQIYHDGSFLSEYPEWKNDVQKISQKYKLFSNERN